MKLQHIDPKLNDKRMWYIRIGEIGDYHLALIHAVNGGVGSTVHAVSKAEYVVVPEEKEDDGQDLI